MPFRFSLKQVLDYRQQMEDNRRREMQEVQKEVTYVEDLLVQAREKRESTRREWRDAIQSGKTMAVQGLYNNYVRGLDHLIIQTESHLAILRQELERRREILVQASREKQVMEALKKEERKQYLVDERREETKEYDEMALRKFSGRSPENFAG